MVPDTLSAVVVFLSLIAPGLLFELLRERRRPSIEETAFREASRAAFTGLLFSGTALILLVLVRVLQPDWMPDARRWIDEGKGYFEGHYRLIARAGLLALLIASGLAILADKWLQKESSGNIRSTNLWYEVFRTDRPLATIPWLVVRLNDGTKVFGFLSQYTTVSKIDEREIALKGPDLEVRSADGKSVHMTDWAQLVIRADAIQYFAVQFVPTDRASP